MGRFFLTMRFSFTILLILVSFTIWSQTSILATGSWHRLTVNTTGVYKLDKRFFENAGIPVVDLNPQFFRLYGIPGGMLPQHSGDFRYNDPQEIHIRKVGMEDGTFDESDYILFYAEGPDLLETTDTLLYHKNLYTNTVAYFFTFSLGMNTPMSNNQNTSQGTPVTDFTDYYSQKEDEVNLLRSGRSWFGEPFSGSKKTTQVFTINTEGAIDSASLFLSLAAQSREGPCSFDVIVNDQQTGSIILPKFPEGTYGYQATSNHSTFSDIPVQDAQTTIRLRFNRASGTAGSEGYFDQLVFCFRRELGLYDAFNLFTNEKVPDNYTYLMNHNGQDDVEVWEVTDPIHPVRQTLEYGDNQVLFSSVKEEQLARFIIFNPNQAAQPSYSGPLDNQNLKANYNLDGVIITPESLQQEAERLATFHRENDGLRVSVVLLQQVFNEFSSGRKDLTAIRDYLKFIHDTGGQLKYALLFGDCSYDPKDRIINNQDIIPIYESRESFNNVLSHSSDDYLGFLEDQEGEWEESTSGDHTLDIGIGRLPVNTPDEANQIVSKIIRYATSTQSIGKWRNEVVYVSDDGDNGIHMRHAEILSQYLSDNHPQVKTKKIYLDSYEQEIQPSSERSEETKVAIRDAITEGALILNYIGHGNEIEWTDERILNTDLINQLTNRHKLPLFVTATCEFGRYDNPAIASGAERLLLSPNGGAIALVTTTRPVYAHTNLKVNEAIHQFAFTKDENGTYPRLGDIIRNAKNNSLSGINNRNFALLGDPMLHLNYPRLSVEIESLETNPDTLSALEVITYSGKIVNSGEHAEHFNGRGIVTIFDIPHERITKGQENSPFNYFERTNSLFRGEVSVVDGTFEVQFPIPKNTTYNYEPGRISIYAWEEEGLLDATNTYSNLILGGTSDQIQVENTPPEVTLYINDDHFRPKDLVGTNSLFIAKISDESGVNISSNGFNQNITLTLDGGSPIELNDYYSADLDSYQNGTILYPLQELSPGRHIARLKVWDSYNNSTVKEVEFNVSDKPLIRLTNVTNFPNPVRQDHEVTFMFEHDRKGEELIINLTIYNLNGEIINNMEVILDDSPSQVEMPIQLVTNSQGAPLRQGMYLYRLSINSSRDGAYNEIINRLLIN